MLLHISNNIINLMMKQFINSFSRFAYPVGLINNYKNGYKSDEPDEPDENEDPALQSHDQVNNQDDDDNDDEEPVFDNPLDYIDWDKCLFSFIYFSTSIKSFNLYLVNN